MLHVGTLAPNESPSEYDYCKVPNLQHPGALDAGIALSPLLQRTLRLIDLGEWFEGGRNIPGEEIDAEAIGLIERNSDWPANHE